jgi:hypothetical protein
MAGAFQDTLSIWKGRSRSMPRPETHMMSDNTVMWACEHPRPPLHTHHHPPLSWCPATTVWRVYGAKTQVSPHGEGGRGGVLPCQLQSSFKLFSVQIVHKFCSLNNNLYNSNRSRFENSSNKGCESITVLTNSNTRPRL